MGFLEDHMLDIISLIGVGITAFFLWDQIKKQTKVDSAQFSMDFLGRTEGKFTDILKHIKEKAEQKNTTPFDPVKIQLMLNHFEYIATFEDDGIIKIEHIDGIFGQALLRIKKDSEIQQIMEDARKNDKTIYSNIISLMNKIEKRH